jgi:hypothetical protein
MMFKQFDNEHVAQAWERIKSYGNYMLASCNLGVGLAMLSWGTLLIVRCWPPSWEPQEEGMMSTAASLPSV